MCSIFVPIFVGTMGPEASRGDVKKGCGSFYFCRQNPEDDKSAFVDAKFDKIDISNGLEWSLDGKVMYYIDSCTAKVEAFDFDTPNGNLTNRRTIFDLRKNGFDKGLPDGMTIDTRGHLWVAVFGGAVVSSLIENLKHNEMLDPLGQAWQNGSASAA